jgi:hypothetical protein
MSARAPQAIWDLYDAIKALVPQASMGGIVGDTAHSFGYHLAREDLPGSDYSVELAQDKMGASDCASALDVSLPSDLMRKCTGNLLAAAKAHDPRLRAVREFCGTLNSSQTYPWQLVPSNGSEGVDTWDHSHLSHIHISILREFADDAAALAPIADVFAGVSSDPLEEIVSLDPNSADYKQLVSDIADAVWSKQITAKDGTVAPASGYIAQGETHARDADKQTAPVAPPAAKDHK